jgi:tetratricopeptide (TPR) repeat protein
LRDIACTERFIVRDLSTAADERYQQAVLACAAHRADAGTLIQAALAADPDCVLAQCLSGFGTLLLMRAERIDGARKALMAAQRVFERRSLDPKECLHLAALDHAVAGRLNQAADTMGRAVALDPLDLAAIKLEHALRFMLGDATGMRQSLERAVATWRPYMPGYGYVQGCLAFALEETGALDTALACGRTACESAPDDAWGAHAIAHCYEMMGRPKQGLAWLWACEPALKDINNFRHHLDWHQALFCLELERVGDALALYDRRLAAIRPDDFRDFANAASLLARIEVEGVAVGDRWRALGDLARERLEEANLTFASLHDLLGLLGARYDSDSARLLATLRRSAQARDGTQARVLAELGLTLAEMLRARRDGAHERAAMLFLVAEPTLARIGGSNSQRDLFWRLAIHSALVAGRRDVARGLLVRRTRYYRHSHWAGALESELAPTAA